MLQADGRRKRAERRVKVRETCRETGWERRKLFHCVQENRVAKKFPKINETQPKEKQSVPTLKICATGFSPSCSYTHSG